MKRISVFILILLLGVCTACQATGMPVTPSVTAMVPSEPTRQSTEIPPTETPEPVVTTRLSDGSGERKLIETEFSTLHPDWHPDGAKISFDTESNLQGDIYVVNVDGSGLQLLIEDGFWADWSPDRMA